MIKAIPTTFLSGAFELFASGHRLGSFRVAPWREAGAIQLGEDRYEISRAGWFSREFKVTKNGEEIGRALQRTYFSGSYELELGSEASYSVEPVQAFDVRHLQVNREYLPAGEIVGHNNNKGSVELRFPPEIPTTDQVTMFGISHLIWDRVRFMYLSIPILLFTAMAYAEQIYDWLTWP